jgi:YD repeat-containing protein
MHTSFLKLIACTVAFLVLCVAPVLAATAQYTYDNSKRLIRVQYDDGASIEYNYDDAGNRTVKQVTPATIWGYQAPATGQTPGATSPAPLIKNSTTPTRSAE